MSRSRPFAGVNRRWLEANLFDRFVPAAVNCNAFTYNELTAEAAQKPGFNNAMMACRTSRVEAG